ncbi:hypothetical protein PM8797T_27170 [Gimesia maris DSM 8797]|nr:hypothetical protein PM8797T_27170 [Gimesia maris DSM 8797]
MKHHICLNYGQMCDANADGKTLCLRWIPQIKTNSQ